MRVHLLGLAHMRVERASCRCAYTMKVYRLAKMLRAAGHEVILYAPEGSDGTIADLLVPCVSAETYEREYGKHNRAAFQWEWNAGHPAWVEFNKKAIYAILKLSSPSAPEPVLCAGGMAHKAVADKMLWNHPIIEPGIGYWESFAPFRVFESYAFLHYRMGHEHGGKWQAARAYDVVIPNAYEPDEFDFSARDPSGYYLYMGRLNWDKGLNEIFAFKEATGLPVKVVGGVLDDGQGSAGKIIESILRAGCEYHPSVGRDERQRLLGGATALLAPSQYVEPFGGIAVEAQLCGVPVLTSDWGAFPETVIQGVTGYRCRTLDDFVFAAKAVRTLRRAAIRKSALARYSTDVVGPQYADFLERVRDVFAGKGWYEVHTDRTAWLRGVTNHVGDKTGR